MTPAAEGVDAIGIVLAGGRSSRMGTDKAGLVYKGERLLDRARALLGAAGCRQVYISGRPDEPDGLEDTNPGGGPAHAVIDMLDRLRGETSGILVIPVDMPKLTIDHLTPLLAAPSPVARIWDGYPLPAWFSCDLVPPDREDVWSIKRLLDLAGAETLALHDGMLDGLKNVNTPEAFARLTSPR